MEEARTVGSLPVANVQELAETCNGSDDQMPERYIRTEASSEEVISSCDTTLEIPIIDLNKLHDPQSSEEECTKLASACQYWGFFQVCKNKFLIFQRWNKHIQLHPRKKQCRLIVQFR